LSLRSGNIYVISANSGVFEEFVGKFDNTGQKTKIFDDLLDKPPLFLVYYG